MTNPFTSKVQTEAMQAEREEISQEYGAQSTQERLSGFVSAGRGLMVLITLISVITEFAFLFLIFQLLTGDRLMVSVGLSLIGVILIEWMKLKCGPLWFKFIFAGWLKDGQRYVIPFLALTVIVGIGFGGSAYLSINGAPLSVENVGKKVLEPNLPMVDLSEIHSRYDKLIDQERNVQADAAKMTWRGKVVSDGREIIAASQANIQEIEQRRTAEIEKAYAENDRIRTEYSGSIANYGLWFKGLGGFCELIGFLLIMLYSQYRANVHRETATNTPTSKKSTPPNPAPAGVAAYNAGTYFRPGKTQSNGLPYQSNQIGFKSGLSPVYQMSAGSVSAVSGQQNPPNQTAVTNTIVKTVSDKDVVYHKGKPYTAQMIINRLNKHHRRVKDAQQRIKAGKGTKRTENALSNNLGWIPYWEGKMEELKQQQI